MFRISFGHVELSKRQREWTMNNQASIAVCVCVCACRARCDSSTHDIHTNWLLNKAIYDILSAENFITVKHWQIRKNAHEFENVCNRNDYIECYENFQRDHFELIWIYTFIHSFRSNAFELVGWSVDFEPTSSVNWCSLIRYILVKLPVICHAVVSAMKYSYTNLIRTFSH